MMKDQNTFLRDAGVEYPVIGGPMYPCSNPELVAAVSEAGALGVIQPITLTYVHEYKLADGIDYIRNLTDKPLGMNLLIEKSSTKYQLKMQRWLEIALQKNIRFFITSLGKPDWVVKTVHDAGGVVYHDVTEKKWAKKAADGGVDGLIAVNKRAGGHAGILSAEELFDALSSFYLPLVCAGGVASATEYHRVLSMGYQAVQMGTRFIASNECSVSDEYKRAIIDAHEEDIVLTERITGVPVSVIATDSIKKQGLRSSSLEQWLLGHPRYKYFMRMLLVLKSLRSLKHAQFDKSGKKSFWQAGKSAAAVDRILSVKDIIQQLVEKKSSA